MSGTGRLESLEFLTTVPGAKPHLGRLDIGLAVRAIGYLADPIPGLPFDEPRAVVPHERGRILDPKTEEKAGAYVAGWLKRGPSGVIGTNRADAAETVASLVADLPELPRCSVPDTERLVELLRARGVTVVEWRDWMALEAHEKSLGAARGSQSVKLHDRKQMLEIALR